MKTSYTLELDKEGKRFWLCEHANGELDPMPPHWTLSFHAMRDVPEQEGSTLPLGTVVEVTIPDQKEAAEREREASKANARELLLSSGFPPEKVDEAIEMLVASAKKVEP